MTPAFDEYEWMKSAPDFKRTSEVNKLNFSLAAQLSARWLRTRNLISENTFKDDVLHSVSDEFVEAFNKCQFEGRFQRIEKDSQLTYFLDGAHTKESVEICAEWYTQQTKSDEEAINVLVFNVTGDRDAAAILTSLHSMNFNYVCFTTNISDRDSDNGKCGKIPLRLPELVTDSNLFVENFNGLLTNPQLDRCIKHKAIWQQMTSPNGAESQLHVCATIQQALDIISDIKENNSIHVNVLFTGSLHLIGSTLGLLNCSQADVKQLKKAKRIRS